MDELKQKIRDLKILNEKQQKQHAELTKKSKKKMKKMENDYKKELKKKKKEYKLNGRSRHNLVTHELFAWCVFCVVYKKKKL